MALTLSIAHIRLPRLYGVLSKSFLKVKHFLNTKAESWCLFICVATNPADCSSHTCRFIFGTESYGGHYGPEFVTYFDQQNALIRSRKIQGVEIVVGALIINKWVLHVMTVKLRWSEKRLVWSINPIQILPGLCDGCSGIWAVAKRHCAARNAKWLVSKRRL